MITAKIIADSISTNDVRITTMELNYPRFIHSEFMTHRMFSRNASSSRAIPVEKMLKQVQETPAMPIHWGKNQPGMQAKEEIEFIQDAEVYWEEACNDTIYWVNHLNRLGLHKQVINRLLEPFQYIKVIVTATEWDNFFKLRLHEDAQPEMMVLAEHMQAAMDNSVPAALQHGEWHLPYIGDLAYGDDEWYPFTTEQAIKCSVARCARVSYLNHDNSNPSIEKDIDLYNKLLEAGHMSPFEHQATPMRADSFNVHAEDGITHEDRYGNLWSGNFRGWIMYRALLDG